MQLTAQRKPKSGEKWVYLTGQQFEIIEVKVDPASQQEVVIYRKYGSYAPLWTLDMDDFMATLKEEDNVLIPYFRKA